ncbi:MAG: GldG family protein [Acidobacteriota bacterium]|nr:GldG family protein [Acidobacteriota bacterium]
MKARQTKYAAYSATYIIIFIAVLVVVNILADRYNKSYDATSNKRFSLSDQTKKIVGDLKQDVNVLYFDKASGFQQGKDLLDRYSNLSSKVKVKYVDLLKNPQLATVYGINRTGEAIVEVGKKREEARTFDEQGVTGALIRDLKGGARMVCGVEGSGEHQLEDSNKSGYSKLKELVGRDNYQTKAVSLLQKAEVPTDCTVLVIGGPTSDYLEPQVGAIKTYIENGGRALIMLDPPLKLGRTDIADNTALTNQLAAWGVTVDKDLILDLNPVGQIMGLGPQYSLVSSYESHPIVNEIKGTMTGFPLARSLEVKNGDKTTVEKLLSSSSTSFATTNLSSPEVAIDEKNDKKGPLLLAAAATYNTGKPNNQGRVVVVGSSSWIANSFISFNGNRDLLLNMMNWLSSDEDLISIRPKEQDDRRITLSRAQMTWVRFVSQFGLPLVIVVAGVFVWWKRR